VEGIGWMDLMDLMDSDVEHKSENTEKNTSLTNRFYKIHHPE